MLATNDVAAISKCLSQFSVTRAMLGVSAAEKKKDEEIIDPPALVSKLSKPSYPLFLETRHPTRQERRTIERNTV